jgi:uncharacterized protein
MTLSMYSASVPVLVRGLTNLSAILDKAVASAEARKIDPAVFVAARLAPDMNPFTAQIQTASDSAKGAGARLTGTEAPSFPDNETTFPELQARIQKTIDYLQSLKPEQFDGAETRDVVMKFPNGEMKFTGQDFLLRFALPNFYFHLTTAYAILRHNGVEIGKMDFLGAR